MGRKKSTKPKRETRTSFTFPSLHQDVVNAVSERVASTLAYEDNSNRRPNNEHPTNVMGKFRCMDRACSTGGWGSKMVAILIKGYAGNRYNAVVFNQRCKTCNQLGTFTLDETSYVDRVAYRVQKWAGVRMETLPYKPKSGLPHKTEFCEGCKRGVCRRTDDWEYD